MVEEEAIKEKISEKKEKIYEKKEKLGEKKEKYEEKFDEKINEKKEKYGEKKEKGKAYSEKLACDFNKGVDEIKESVRNMQRYADEKINEYKNATVSNIAVDLVETNDMYYLKVAVPGLDKDEVEIEAGDNDIVINATFKALIDEFEDVEDAKVIACEMRNGECSKTVRFENSIDVEQITAKYSNGVVRITVPKLIIPKHKVTVE